MERFMINPEDYKAKYIENLNQCFNGWGSDKEYEWVFDRKVGEHESDILLIANEQDGVIAGSGISYRQLADAENSINIGIMTGSWTLPAARRKGCFTKMINCSKDLCKKKEVPFLTAFVTETNPSCRRLESEGSFLFPTSHLFSPEVLFENETLPEAEILEDTEENRRLIYEITQKRQSKFLNFRYSFREFSNQYINRIKKTTLLKFNNDYFILENGINEVKILLFTYENKAALETNIKAATNWCLKSCGKKAFFFTTREEVHASAKELGFENVPGYFTILSSFDEEVSYKKMFNALNINMADKM